MQQPTCTNVRIRSTADAHKIFGAVQQGILHMVTRRLDADERLALRSGCIYAWEERGPHSEITGLGIERFTEGRRWSPSRVRDEFLFYYEKYSPPPDVNHLGGSVVERQPPRDWDPLVKQTYSVWVDTAKGRRKWHLTSYFTQATIDQLGTIDDIARVRDVVVPEGLFKSTRIGKSRTRTEDPGRSDVSRAATSVSRTYAPFPTPYRYQAQNRSPSSTPVLMHEPYQTSHISDHHSSAYDQSPSPISPQLQGHYLPAQPSYQNPSSSSYSSSYSGDHTLPRPMSSSSPTQSYQLPAMQHSDNQSYYSSGASSSSSWGNTALYGSSSPPRSIHQVTSSNTSPTYNTPNTHNNHNPTPYSFSPPIPPIASMHGNDPIYSPSYSLHSALVPAANQLDGDSRSAPLSPLQIPERPYLGSQPQTSPLSSAGGSQDSPEFSLAPLGVLKKPIRGLYNRREPADEKTLRLLRVPRNSP